MLLSERIEAEGVTVRHGAMRMNEAGTHMAYDVTLHRGNHTFTLPDPFETNGDVTTFEVLDLLLGACGIIHQAQDRQAWASEYTTDPEEQDKHFTQENFDMWVKIDHGLAELLGDGDATYEDWLYDTDRQS